MNRVGVFSNLDMIYPKSVQNITESSPTAYDGIDEGYVNPTFTTSVHETTTMSSSKKMKLCTMCGRYKGFEVNRNLCIISIVGLILLLLTVIIIITFYAIIPAIIRDSIRNAQISFRSINIDNMQSAKFHLSAESVLTNTGSISAIIISPITINVNNFGSITKEQSINVDGTTTFQVDSSFFISDLQAYNNFARSFVFEGNVVCQLTATLSVQPLSKAMPVYSNIPFDKRVTFIALNGLRDINIQSVNFHRSSAQRVIVDLVIEIMNPSIFSINLGP